MLGRVKKVLSREQTDKMINILLAPRLSDNEAGHHYWYPRIFTKNNDTRNQVIFEKSNTSVHHNDRIWNSVNLGCEWGHDLGFPSPLRLYITLKKAILKKSRGFECRVITFESSLSLLLALNFLALRMKNTRFHLCLLDGGFWRKILMYRVFAISLARIMKSSLTRNLLFLYAQSEREANEFSKLLNIPVHTFPVMSTLANSTYFEHIGTGANSSIYADQLDAKLLVLPTVSDVEHMVEVSQSLIMKSKNRLLIRMHAKVGFQNGDKFPKNLSARFIVTTGVLSQREYAEMFLWADIVYLPYTTPYHINGSSGKVIDALSAGCFVILDSRFSVEQYHALQEFIFHVDQHNVLDLESSIEKYIRFKEAMIKTNKKIKKEIVSASKREFSLENLLSRLSALESRETISTIKGDLTRPSDSFLKKVVTSWLLWKMLGIIQKCRRVLRFFRTHLV